MIPTLTLCVHKGDVYVGRIHGGTCSYNMQLFALHVTKVFSVPVFKLKFTSTTYTLLVVLLQLFHASSENVHVKRMEQHTDSLSRSGSLTQSSGNSRFSDFLHEETSLHGFTMLNILNSILALVMLFSFSTNDVDALFLMPVLLKVLLMVPFNMYQSRLRNPHRIEYTYRNIWLGDCIILFFVVANGAGILVHAFPGNCDSPLCPHYDGELPTGHLLAYFSQVLCMMVVVKCHHRKTSWVAILIQFIFAVIIGIQLFAQATFFMGLVLAFLFEVLIVFDYKRYLHRTHAAMLEIESTVRAQMQTEHNRHMEEMVSTELRFLIGNVAHDLKTPLHSFMLELDNLLEVVISNSPVSTSPSGRFDPSTLGEKKNVQDHVGESVRLLKNICSFMLMTINRAIDHTKTSSGIKLVPKHETVELKEALMWVDQCMGSMESVPLVINPIPRNICSHVITDRQWLLENVLCLVSNAHKFTNEGSVQVCCSLQSSSSTRHEDAASIFHNKAAGGSSNTQGPVVSSEENTTVASETAALLVEVEDTGIGIPVEKRLALFRPFQQAQRRAGGTGLGLFSMANRIAALGGLCGVSDRKDGQRGSRFWFSLPYRPDESLVDVEGIDSISTGEEKERELEPLMSSCAAAEGDSDHKLIELPEVSLSVKSSTGASPSRVLLVEDSLMIRKTTLRSFQRAHIEVDVAVNGQECLDKIEEEEYTLILMDIQMPVMDGLEAVYRLRNLPEDNNRPTDKRVVVIGVSANSDSESEKEAIKAGMDYFLPKPLSLQVLKDCLLRLNSPLVPKE